MDIKTKLVNFFDFLLLCPSGTDTTSGAHLESLSLSLSPTQIDFRNVPLLFEFGLD